MASKIGAELKRITSVQGSPVVCEMFKIAFLASSSSTPNVLSAMPARFGEANVPPAVATV